MAEKSWTPGPWKADSATVFGGSDENVVARCFGSYTHRTVPDIDWNAKLIAAAPDLYDALYAVMLEFGPGTMSDSAFNGACAALRKARGKADEG